MEGTISGRVVRDGLAEWTPLGQESEPSDRVTPGYSRGRGTGKI